MADESAKEFSAAVKALEKASNELSQNTGKEVGKIVGKDLLKVTEPFVNSFKQIPGVATLGNVGKTLFNKGFAALKDKREKQLLADRLGLTKQEFKQFELRKKTMDAELEVQEKMGAAAEKLLGLDPEKIVDALSRENQNLAGNLDYYLNMTSEKQQEMVEGMNKLSSLQVENAKKRQGNRAKQEELEAEQAASEKKNRSLLESMVDGITTLNKSFLAGLKDKGKFAIAGLAALIAAPVVALVSFFKQLAVEFAFLKKLTRVGAIGKIFTPLVNLFTNLTAAFKGTTFGALAIDKVKNVITAIKNFFAPVGRFFSTIFGQIATLTKASASASGILKFASGFGTILGKIFLPITILMSAFDFVTGFMEGYKEDGIIGGLRDGVSKLFANLIGAPLNMLKDAAAWVLRQFGFNESAEELKKFDFKKIITDILSWPFNQLLKIIDMVKNFDFKKLIPNNAITRTLGLVGDDDEGESLDAQIKKREKELKTLRADAENQGLFETDASQARAVKEFTEAQKELEKMKAELAAQRAGGGTNVNASTTVNDARQSKTTNVTGAPIVDTSAAGALAAAN